MASRIGVLQDPFDPVRPVQIGACLSALESGSVDSVFLVQDEEDAVCLASARDRWQMLAAACSCSRDLIPSRHSLHALRKKHGSRLVLLSVPDPDETLSPSVEEYCSLKGLYGAVSRLPQAGPWVDSLFADLNPHRFAHSLSVARTSLDLALRYGEDPVRAETAGLLHDCAKCLSLTEMQKIARKARMTEDPSVLESPALLHSLAGVPVARSRYGVEDSEILDAIAYHNTGCAGMSRLAMCVCLADFIEPNRDPFPLLEDVRRLAGVSLEKALLLSLEGVADHVRSKGKNLHPRTLNAIAWLKSLPAVQSASDPYEASSISMPSG